MIITLRFVDKWKLFIKLLRTKYIDEDYTIGELYNDAY